MEIEKILKRLLSKSGASGFEENAAECAKELLMPYCDEVHINKFKSVIGVKKCGRQNAKKVMLEAHLDRIGLMVTKIDENGFVRFTNIGGVDPRILPGSEVCIMGREKVFGIVGALPPHLSENSDRKKLPRIKDMLIDIGMSKAMAETKIAVGDSIMMSNAPIRLQGGEFSAPGMDNRAGMTAVLYAAELQNIQYDIYFVFSSEEELGFHGAFTAAAEIEPDFAVVVDVTHGMTPDTKDEAGVFRTGSGAIICRGPNFDNSLTKRLIECAKENNIRYDIEVASGCSGTNAWAIQNAKNGCKTLLISIPLKYMHTSVETIDLNDIEETGRLIKSAIREGIFGA